MGSAGHDDPTPASADADHDGGTPSVREARTLDDVRPRVGVWRRLRRALLLCAGITLLMWAWRASGIDPGRLIENRERAWTYMFGSEPSATQAEELRREAERSVRVEEQTKALEALRREYADRGEPTPGMLQLMRDAESRAAEALAAMPPDEMRRRIDERASRLAGGGRRGGYFPPETDPRRVLGDPDRTTIPSWLADATEGWPPSAARGARWVYVALNGEGYTGELVETIAIATWGTFSAVIAALPAAFLGSGRAMRVIASGSSGGRRSLRGAVVFLTRRSFDVARGFNEVVMAMIFVAVLGLGPFAGVLALFVHTYGVLGKVFSEAIESADDRPVEGVQSTGAAPLQVLSIAFMPQILPYVASQSLLRFESNVRGATILGVVGAGGIGQMLMDKFSAYEYREVATMMIIIIVVVTLIDLACGRVMRRFV